MSAVAHLPLEGDVVLACRDTALVRAVVDQLARFAIDVRTCGDESTVEAAFADRLARVAVVDLGMYDGLDTIMSLRLLTDAPTIALIDSQRTVDPVEAIEVGADDFVLKPCAPRDVAAKVRAWLRRSSGGPIVTTAERFGALAIDFGAREVRVRGQLVPVPPKEFDLLAFLAQRPRRAVPPAAPRRRGWNGSPPWPGAAPGAQPRPRLRRRRGH